MPSVASVLAALAEQAPGDKAASWDPDGLQIGDPDADVTRVAVCHEVTDSVVETAVTNRIELLITYHPLLLRPEVRLLAGRGPGGRAFRLLSGGTAVAIAHTSWDAANGGTADALADAIGLSEVSGFGPIQGSPQVKLVTFVPTESSEAVAAALAGAGAGQIGRYSSCSFRSEGVGTFLPMSGSKPVVGTVGTVNVEQETRIEVVLPKSLEASVVAALLKVHPYEEPSFDLFDVRSNLGVIGRVGRLLQPLNLSDLAASVALALGGPVRWAGRASVRVERVAVLPGSGGSMVGDAAMTGAEVYLTGDLSHHQTRDGLDRSISLIDPGHARTERPGVGALLAAVRRIHSDAIDLIEDPTPWEMAS
jgi:dinuclear metal center YbgI/SA1388 family protein